jgi:peptidoglycan/LPS O-acetylase OafA/YrhL
MTVGVFVAHIHYAWLPGSILFMDTFFMMSSFFITRLLLKDWARNGRINFKAFYARRVKRLYPALLLMVLGVTLFTWFYLHHHADRMLNVVATLFYFANWIRAYQVPHEIYLGHTWSLSIEEQFYLLWPVLLALGLRLALPVRTVNRKLWLPLLVALIAAVFAWRAWLVIEGADVVRLYNGTDMRVDSLAAGALLAMVFDHPVMQRVIARVSRPWFAWLCLATLFVGGLNVSYFDRDWYQWQQPVFVLVSFAAIVSLLNTPEGWGLRRVLQNPVSLYLGAICYGMYLWHYPIIEICRTVFGLGIWQTFAISAPLTLGLASLSYHWVELPVLNGKTGSAK